ncbi:MAG TPA: alpha/beta hydrolase, partial [Tepidiformaceae bacterium]|nr:alpha/beta hydrolase [Tepidiformaceae bacterium]
MLKQQVRFCTSPDGVRTAYAITGDGPPLVFPSTWQTHVELDPGLLGYSHWLEGLSRHHTLIRGELRGAGLSDWEVPSMDFEDWVWDLEAMVDDAGLERFPIFGLSHASATAIEYTVRHPERVSHLVLYAASARAEVSRVDPAAMRKLAVYMDFQREFWDSTDPRMQWFFTSSVVPAASREIVAALDKVRRQSMNADNSVRALKTIVNTDVMARLPEISVPTLVLHPKAGTTVKISEAREVAAAIPDARLVLLDCENHLMQAYEPGWPRLLEETWRFLGVDLDRVEREPASRNGASEPEPALS